MHDFSRRLPGMIALLTILISVSAAVLPSVCSAVTFNNISGSRMAAPTAPVTAISVAATSPAATALAGTDGGGIYAMNVGGSSWTQATAGMTNRRVQSVAVHPADPTVIYAGTRAGLFRSQNSGQSWSAINSGLANRDVRALAITPTSSVLGSTVVFAGTAAGVYKSTDGGVSWTAFNGAGLTSTDIYSLLISGTVLYAGTGDGVFSSPYAASSWSAATGFPASSVITAMVKATAGTFFAGTSTGGAYTSSDGSTWTPDSGGLANLLIHSLSVDSSGNNVYAGTEGGVFRKTYATQWPVNWSSSGSGITTPNIIRSLATGSSNRVYAGTDLGVFTSTNGGSSWSQLNGGLVSGQTVAINPSNPTLLSGGLAGGGGYSSSNRGVSWSASVSGLTNSFVTALAFDPATAGLVYAATGAGIFRSADSGQTWTDITGNISNTDVRALAIPVSGSPPLHAGTSAGVFTWDGVNWITHTGGLPGNPAYPDVTCLAFSGATLFAGTNGSGIYRSVGGAAWTQLLTGLGSSRISAMAVDASAGFIYAGTDAGVHKSTLASNGDTWTRIANNTSDNIRSLAVNQTVPPGPATPISVLVAGTSAGAFATTDAGATWSAIPNKSSDAILNGLALDDQWPQSLHAATGRGLASTQLIPALTVTPATGYAISPAHINSIKNQQLAMANAGLLDLTISNHSISNYNLANLSAPPSVSIGGTSPCASLPTVGTPVVLRANQSCTLVLTFTPTVSGSNSADVTFTSNDTAVPNRTVTLNWLADDPLPTSQITSPVNGESIRTPKQVVGIASDIGSGLQDVKISVDGGTNWLPTTQTVPGSWASWQYNWSPLADGTYFIESKAFDFNVSPASNEQSPLTLLTVYVDNTLPTATVSSPADNASVKGLSATISGTAADPVTAASGSGIQKVEVSTDGGTTWLDATGTTSWTFAWTLPSDGIYDIIARATDKAGNLAVSTNTSHVRVDNTVPTGVAITAPLAGATLPVGTTYTITGTASDAGSGIALVEVSTDNGGTWQSTTYTSPADTWSYSWNLPVNGTYQILARATDRAGNITTTPPQTTVINNPLPTASILSPLPGAQTHGATVAMTLSARVTVPNLTLTAVEVSLGGGAWQQANCTLTTAPGATPADYSCSCSPALPQNYYNAAYSITAHAIDAIGNVQSPTSDITVVLDNKLPTTTISVPVSGAYLQRTAQTVTGTATDYELLSPPQGLGVQLVELSFDNGVSWAPATGTNSWSGVWTPPADGSYTIQARATDMLGNQQNPLTTATVTIDSVAPVAVFTATPHNPSNSLTPSFSFTSDEATNFTCTLKNTATNAVISSGYCGCTPTASSYAASCTQALTIAGAGSYSLTVLPVDRAGNTGSAIVYPWLIDITPVVLASKSPAAGARLVSTSTTITAIFNKDIDPVSITTASGANTFQLDNGIAGTVTYDPVTFTATFTPNPRAGKSPLDYGTTYTATLTAGIADTAGNQLQGAPISWSFTTDPDGDINGDGVVSILDALLALYMSVGRMTSSDVALMRPIGSQTKAAVISHGDVGPLQSGRPNPDGLIDIRDALVILGRSIGLYSW